jgi:hypothetical protein
MPFSHLKFLDTSGLPRGLPESNYLTWRMALRDMRSGQTAHQVEQKFQYCRGFVQALMDADVIDSTLYLALEEQAQAVWVETITALEFKAP